MTNRAINEIPEREEAAHDEYNGDTGEIRDGEDSCETVCTDEDENPSEASQDPSAVISEKNSDSENSPQEDERLLTEESMLREHERRKAREELLEFYELFPNVVFTDIPLSVRESPLPLAAAYALYEAKEKRILEKAEEENRKNLLRSAGRISDGGDTLYSPEEVRRMTRSEVRANYEGILRSMKKWR